MSAQSNLLGAAGASVFAQSFLGAAGAGLFAQSFLGAACVSLLASSACGPVGGTAGEPPKAGGVQTSSDAGATQLPTSFDAAATGASPDGSTPVSPGGYRVVGPKVLDQNGNSHIFHGLDRPSLEWSATGDSLSASDYMMMKTWNANVVRISMNQDYWLSNASSYRATIDQQVHWAEAAGLDVILDLHWSDKGQLGGPAGQQCMADQNSITFWSQVAAVYMTDGRVLFELYNEPHDVPVNVWLGGGAGCGFQVAGMQQLYNAVRGAGANNIVIVGGLRYAFDLSFVSGYSVQGFNVMYSTHPYHSQYMDKEASSWYAAFGYLAATVPVMATEFGDQIGNTDGCETSYYSNLIQYFNGTLLGGYSLPANPIHWSGWGWYPGDCSFPALIKDWQGTPTPPGAVEKAALLSY